MITQENRFKILYYLRYSSLTLVEDSTHFSNIIKERMETISQSDEASVIINEILEELNVIDQTIKEAKTRLLSSSVGDIEINGEELKKLRSERRTHIRELADYMDLPMDKAFGATIVV